MSTSVALSGSRRSAAALERKNPFTGEMQKIHAYVIAPEEQEAITAVLERHRVKDAGNGELATLLFSERSPDGFPLYGTRDEDGLSFHGNASLSKPACVLLYDLAASADLVIHGDTFGAVTTDEAMGRLDDEEAAVVRSADELYDLIQRSLED